MKNWLQKKFIRFLVTNLFNAIDEGDILRLNEKGAMVYQGKDLTREAGEIIKIGAVSIKESLAWKVITEDMMYVANQRMWFKGQSAEDILAGKMILYTCLLYTSPSPRD